MAWLDRCKMLGAHLTKHSSSKIGDVFQRISISRCCKTCVPHHCIAAGTWTRICRVPCHVHDTAFVYPCRGNFWAGRRLSSILCKASRHHGQAERCHPEAAWAVIAPQHCHWHGLSPHRSVVGSLLLMLCACSLYRFSLMRHSCSLNMRPTRVL